MRSSRLPIHLRRVHKKEIPPSEAARIVSNAKKPGDRGRAWIKSKKRDRKETEGAVKKLTERTPFSMRQWGDDRPHRTGPI